MKLSLQNLFSALPTLRPRMLKILIPACGGVSLLLLTLLVSTGTDEKGLVTAGHPAWIGIGILAAAAALALLVGVRPIRGPGGYRLCFPASPLGALGCGLAAVSAVLSAIRHWQDGTPLYAAISALAVLAFAALALCRLTARKPQFLLHVAVCIYFAIEMLNLYQTWSFDPQLHEYCFQLFACIALTITAYQLAAFDGGKGSHRALWAWALTAVYFSCMSLGSGLFFLTGGVWAFTNLSNLRRPRRKPMEPEQAAE